MNENADRATDAFRPSRDPALSLSSAAVAVPPGDPATDAVPNQSEGELAAATVAAEATPARGSSDSLELWRVGTLTYAAGGIVVLFFWLLFGDFALAMRERSVGPLTQLFVRSQGASDFTMTVLLVALPPAIGLILSPIVSYRSDRLRSRWGRRIPYLLIPTPIAALSMVGIAFSPHLGGLLSAALDGRITPHQATLAVFTPLWVAFEVAVIVSGSVFLGLINDVVPRGRLGRFHGLFRAVSLGDAIIFNLVLLPFAKTHFTLMFAAIGIVFGVGFTLMCLKVREGEYPPPPAHDPSDTRAGGFRKAVGIYIRECFSQPYYRTCFAMFTIATLTFMPVNLFAIYYRDQLGMSLTLYGQILSACYFISMFLAYGIGWLADRYHPMRVGMATLAIYAAAMVVAFFFVVGPTTFAVATFIHTVLSGSYFTATASLQQKLLPRRQFAQFASAGGAITSISTIVVGPALGLTMTLTGSYYRLTWLFGAAFAAVALVLMIRQYRAFQQHGGPEGYVAPGDVEEEAAARARGASAVSH